MMVLNIVAEGAYKTAFATWNKITFDDIERIKGYAQEVYGKGVPLTEFGSCLSIVLAMLTGWSFVQCDPKLADSNSPTIYIKSIEPYAS